MPDIFLKLLCSNLCKIKVHLQKPQKYDIGCQQHQPGYQNEIRQVSELVRLSVLMILKSTRSKIYLIMVLAIFRKTKTPLPKLVVRQIVPTNFQRQKKFASRCLTTSGLISFRTMLH